MGIFNVLITVVFGAFGKGSIHWCRDYERGCMTSPRGMCRDKNTGLIRVWKAGLVIRPAWLYTWKTVRITIRNDQITIKAMRPTPDGDLEKSELTATARWHVRDDGEYPYHAIEEWSVDDLGEFARGVMQDAIRAYLETHVITDNALDSEEIFSASENAVREELLEHGVVWKALYINDKSRADAQVQASATTRIAEAIMQIARWLQRLVRR